MSGSNIQTYFDEYADLREQSKKIAARMKELDKLIRPYISDEGGDVTYGRHRFILKIIPGRQTLDKKAVEAAGIDLAPYYKTGAPFTQLNISNLEEDK